MIRGEKKMSVFAKRMIAIALTCTIIIGFLVATVLLLNKPEKKAGKSGPQDSKEVEKFADAFFNRPDIKENMAGASFVVVKGDKVLLNKGYGYADVENKKVVDPKRTVFRVASISKVITATGVMQLAEKGKIDINKNLSAYLGDVQIHNQTNTPLTMRHLLTNATGFEYGDGSELETRDFSRETSIQQYISGNKPTVVRKPGAYYRYDNLGFIIQGHVIEQVTGEPFGSYMKDHIFKKLGMNSSDFRLTAPIRKNLAVPYDASGKVIPAYAAVPTENPSGGMLSTGADMAKFMMAHLNGGKLGAATILKKETVEEMHQTQLAIHEKLPNMAYGFEYDNQQHYNGKYVIGKSGDMAGYHSNMWLLPDEKIGFYIATNNDFDFRKELLEAFMNHYYPSKEEKQHKPKPSKDNLANFAGTYGDLRNRMWTSDIRSENGKLIVKDPFGEHILHEVEPLLFEDEEGTRAAFKLNENGEVQAFYYDLKPDSWTVKMPEPKQYKDVAKDHPYAASIYHMRQLKVIDDGEGNYNFDPEKDITREQFIGWFIRWAGIAPSHNKLVFNDISNSAYAKEIQAAYELGLIQDAEKFYPQQPIQRQEAAMIVWKMASQHLGATSKKAALDGDTDSWALEGVRFAVAKQLYGPEVKKGENGKFNYHSKQSMKKQEAAAMLSQFAKNLF